MAEQELRAVRDRLIAEGIEHGMDFAVLGTGQQTALSSELVVLHGDGDGWHVDYRDMGRSRELLRTDDLPEATARFVDEVHRLAGERGRGPLSTGPRRTRSLEQVKADRAREQR